MNPEGPGALAKMALTEEILANLDFSPRQVSDLVALIDIKNSGEESLFEFKMTTAKYKQFWNHYSNELDFYKKCFQMAQNMTRSDLKQVMGESGKRYEDAVLSRLHKLNV